MTVVIQIIEGLDIEVVQPRLACCCVKDVLLLASLLTHTVWNFKYPVHGSRASFQLFFFEHAHCPFIIPCYRMNFHIISGCAAVWGVQFQLQ